MIFLVIEQILDFTSVDQGTASIVNFVLRLLQNMKEILRIIFQSFMFLNWYFERRLFLIFNYFMFFSVDDRKTIFIREFDFVMIFFLNIIDKIVENKVRVGDQCVMIVT